LADRKTVPVEKTQELREGGENTRWEKGGGDFGGRALRGERGDGSVIGIWVLGGVWVSG